MIAKLKSNVPLTGEDVNAPERILCSEVGTKQEYEAEYGAKPLGEILCGNSDFFPDKYPRFG